MLSVVEEHLSPENIRGNESDKELENPSSPALNPDHMNNCEIRLKKLAFKPNLLKTHLSNLES